MVLAIPGGTDREFCHSNSDIGGPDDLFQQTQWKNVSNWQYDFFMESIALAYGVFLPAYGWRYPEQTEFQYFHSRIFDQYVCTVGSEYHDDDVLFGGYVALQLCADIGWHILHYDQHGIIPTHFLQASQYDPCADA